MKKKVFSLMMTLLLAFMGVAKADVVTIGEGTGTTYYFPIDNFFNYSCTQQIYTADEIGTAGTINSISFYYNYGTAYTANNVTMYMKNVSRSEFASTSDYEPLAMGDIVWTGAIAPTAAGWYTFTLDTPFEYNGTDNLLVAFFDGTSGYPGTSYTWRQTTSPNSAYMALRYYSDSTCPDPYNLGSYSGSKTWYTYRANAQIDITPGGGGAGTPVTQTITIGEGTTTYYYYPVNMYFNYSLTEQIYTADEIGTGEGTIDAISFYYDYTSSFSMDNVSLYMKNVTREAFASNTDMEPLALGDIVWTGTLSATEAGWITINLDTPFAYDGGNLLVGAFDGTSGYPGSSYKFRTSTCDGYKGIHWYSDSYTPDPYNTASGFSGSKSYTQYRNNIQLTITTMSGGSTGPVNVLFAVQNGQDVETVEVGPRPNGAWMEPFTFQLRNEGPATTVSLIDFTPEDYFTVVNEMPFDMARNDTVDIQLTTGTSADTLWQMVAIYGEGRTARIWEITAEPYDPAVPDVWELAYDLGTVADGFTYQGIPSQITPTVLHDNYNLPFPEIPEGQDAVYKFTVESDVMISAHVDEQAANGKIALYTEDFYGEGGPMANNNYQGLDAPGAGGSGSAGGAFQAMIGDENSTTTSTYFPFHTLWNYSLAENLFLASELTEAGVTTAPMTSLSWYVNSTTCTTPQNNISIWMANVSDAALTTTSHTTAGMTLVYTGNNVLPTAGQWNEFVFNAGNFAWDGHSNILILCQRNNGSWQGSISWKTHNPGFAGMAYAYNDNNAYEAGTQTYSMSTSTTNRQNIIFKGGNRERSRELVTIAPGGYNAVAIPVNFIWAYTENEMILTADEIGTDGNITSIAYKRYSEGSGNPETRNIDVYMKHVSVDNFASTADWIAVSAADLVFSGNHTFQTTGEDFQAIELQTPFAYNGTDNLLICIDDNTGTTTTRQYWSCHYTTGFNRSMRAWGSSNFDPTAAGTPVGGSSLTGNWVADIQLNVEPAGSATPTNHIYSAGPVIENLPLRAGTYYLVASATQDDYTVYINVDDMPCPAIDAPGFAFNPTPEDDADEVEPGSVTLRWMVPDYATGWRLVFGSTYHPDPNHSQTIMYPEDGSFSNEMANSFTVRNLWNNTNYFWHVEFNNDACPNGVSSPIWGFTTHFNIPQNLTAEDYTVFNDEQIVLHWNAVVDRTYRYYFIYRDGVKIGETPVNQIGTTTYTDGPLAYNMGGYEYYVTAIYDEGESAPSDPVTVKVSGRGNVNGHVYEQDGITGIAGATVHMVGQDEFGVTQTYNFTTNAQGYYSGAVYAGEYNGSASCDGYQTINEPVQGNPIDITYNVTTSPIDYMLDENFDPVCAVIAEYYPDSLDPTSPYVKVYWGCGLPGSEIIEDFETGDFSLFDWNVNGSYPWEVTTTHPYEGTYCMRSTNYNVASSTSSIDVTVDIPADGIMSFYGYISSENNYDYGYFYIDGVQKGSYAGAGNSWGEKKFDITEGTHNFKWSYQKDGSVNSNEDRFYVDYITFYKQPEPAQPGWHTYCESEFNNAVGSSISDTPSWAYEYPASFLHANYAGWNITKVSLFSDNMYSAVGGNYTCRIYVGGTQPAAGSMVSELTVDVPSNQNAWVDWDLTTPVSVTGNDAIWVVWTANTHTSSWPAGCCGDLNDYGTWWDGGNGWEHLTYGTWTMRHWFTNRAGRSVAVEAADCAPVAVADSNPISSKLAQPVKGEESNTICANENAVKGAALDMSNNRSLNHYRVYRTNCYNDGPYTEENTVLLATVWVPDTVYMDVEWADLEPGVYKWGVGAVYEGNRGEMIESPISWAAPVAITRDATADATTAMPAEDMNRAPWDLLVNFDCTSGYQYGVATDGNYIYTSSWSASSSSQFYKYDMNGNFVEEFNVSGSGQIRDLTYDGQYFYGVANSSTVYCLDLANHALVSSFTSAYGTMRCCGYDPQRDGFWVVGNWSGNLTLIDRTGAIVITGPAPTSASGVAYYKDENNVEHVYCFNNGNNQIYDYDIASNTIAGSPIFDFSATPGYTSGSSGGCHIANYGDKMAFYGDLQQSPNVIGVYELREGDNPGGQGGNTNNLNQLALPRESETIWSNCLDKDMYLGDSDVTVNVLLNSADSPEGIQVSFTNYNEAEQEMYPVAPITLDETGYYAFESFRRGNYKVNVTFDGYEPIEDSVSIWEPTDLRYVMIEIIYGASDLYVSRTGWAMWGSQGIPSNGQGGGNGGNGNGDTFDENFDNGQLPAGWTTVDADGDGYTWVSSANPGVYHNSGVNLEGTGHNSSAHYVISGSYANGLGYALTPDNYLVTPQMNIANGSTFSFWACAQDASWAAEHFGVAISSNGTSDWTMVNEWTMTAKANGAMSYGRDGETRAQGNWYNYTVDLSAYAGQKYIAIRHFNCTDMFILNVDDITLTNGAKNAENERHLESFKVLCTSIDGEPIFNTNVPAEQPFCQLATDQLVEGDHYICKVAAVYSTGMSDWAECEWEYESCENYTPIEGLEVTPENEGNHLVWEFAGGGGGGQGGSGDTFTESWDNGLNGWTNIDNDGDGHMWYHSTEAGNHSTAAVDSHSGAGHLMGESYCNATWNALTPDDYVVSPQQYAIAAGSTISLWACTQDVSYPSEHFGFAISTGSNTNANDFTTIAEWTITAKGAGNGIIGRDGRSSREGAWYQFSADLSSYAGQNVWIAVRHFNCTDMFILNIDDIELANGAKGTRDVVAFNGFVTDPGAMANGADASWTKNGQGTWGPNANYAAGSGSYYWLADSFTLSAATTISEIEVYGYQTGSSTTSTFTGLYAQIYNGAPNAGGTAIWGNTTSNIMTATAFTNCYRGSDGETTATTRPIMSVTAGGLNIELEAGTYYLVYALTGSSSSGPWGAPHGEPTIGNTGNGYQCTSSGWTALTDSGSSTPYGCSMKITGTGGGGTPTPVDGVLGFMVFRDGEWLAEILDPNAREYTDIDELGEHEYCVRVIYDGTNVLPSNNYFYAMSCPVCEGGRCIAGEPIHGELLRAGEQVRIWWGETAAIEGVVKYNVYRSTDNANYTMIGEVPAVEGQIKYEYIDTPDRSANTYYYQVRADYGYCESEPAISAENPSVNYVVVSTTGVDENGGMAIFPNPTKGNVTIQASGMQHITVVSVLGQVVYDADVTADEVILNMSQYSAGMYTVRVMTENGMRVERISVVR